MLLPIGVNMPSLFAMYLGTAPEGPAQARAQMDSARALGVTHARFIASGFWPADMKGTNGWVTNKAGYWAAFDQMVADAHARGLRLVPSILWNLFLFPDLAGQPAGMLFTPGSTTRMMAEQYVTEMVTRYANEPAIAAWELGNEMNLLVDLDFSTCNVCGTNTNNCGGLAPSLGTPCQRTAADNLFSCNSCRGVSTTQQDLGQFAGAIAQLIHSLDTLNRPVSSGDGYPRTSAWHLGNSPCPACDWTADSQIEYQQALAQLHPAGVDLVSVHHYPGADCQRFGDVDPHGEALLSTTKTIVDAMGKQLYVGEWGEPRSGSINCGGAQSCDGDDQSIFSRRMLLDLVADQVPMSGLWAYDFHQFCAATPTCYGVEDGDPLAQTLATAAAAATACIGMGDGSACPQGHCVAQACTPDLAHDFALDTAQDVSAWLSWTNCTSCTPGSATAISFGSGGALLLTANDLPCTGTCGYPGSYTLSPSVPVSGGQVLARVEAQAAGGDANVRLMAMDSNDQELGASVRVVPAGAAISTYGAWLQLPVNTAAVRVRFEQTNASSSLTVDRLRILSYP